MLSKQIYAAQKGTSIEEAYLEGKEPHFTEGFLEAQENGKEENSTNIQLYARSAVLMDADSGRVLFGKNENEQMPMASTTKIMTCILALENGNMDDMVTVSSYAVSQPKLHLGIY